MNTEKLIERLFSLLDNWRNLPSYQLERRADIFFALYLTEIIKKKFGTDITHIIPEFPVRIGNIYSKANIDYRNRSFKIDYVTISEKADTVYFIELKTDDSSRREKQDWYLESAKNVNIRNLIDGILEINKVTGSKKKYRNLLNLLSEIGWLDESLEKNKAHDYKVENVYIQPNQIQSDNSIISFDEIIDFLSEKDDELTKRFIKSLKEWKISPN